MNRRSGQSAIVTGGAVGIGHACVRRLTSGGADGERFHSQEEDRRRGGEVMNTDGVLGIL